MILIVDNNGSSSGNYNKLHVTEVPCSLSVFLIKMQF